MTREKALALADQVTGIGLGVCVEGLEREEFDQREEPVIVEWEVRINVYEAPAKWMRAALDLVADTEFRTQIRDNRIMVW